MKKCYAMIHVWLHDMDHNIDLNYCRKIRPIDVFRWHIGLEGSIFFIYVLQGQKYSNIPWVYGKSQ